MSSQQLVEQEITALKPYSRNARTHSKKQIKQIAASIERFGFTNPVLVSDSGGIIAGRGRVEAAKLIGMKTVPTLALSHLTEAERRAYVLADNKLALNAGWDRDILAIEFQGLIDLDSIWRSPGLVWPRSTSHSTRRARPVLMGQMPPRMRCLRLVEAR